MIATQELVVPRSMPMMSPAGPLEDSARREAAAAHRGRGEGAEDGPPRMCASCLCVDLAGDKTEGFFVHGGRSDEGGAACFLAAVVWKITLRDRGQTTAVMVLAAG